VTRRSRRGLEGCPGRLLALAAGLVVAAAAGELLARIAIPPRAPSAFDVYLKDASGRLRLQPGVRRQHAHPEWDVSIETNPSGFRDRAGEAGPNEPRVVVVGDSIAFGWGVEYAEAFPTLLEAALPDRRVVKAGIPATGPSDQLALLRELVPGGVLDAVVVTFFVGNDFADQAAGGVDQYDVWDGTLVHAGGAHTRPRGLSLWVKRHSRLAQLVAERWWELRRRLRARVPVERRDHPGLDQRDAFLERYIQVHLRAPLPEDLERGVVETRRVLDAMRELAAEREARFVLLVVPRSIQVYDVDRRRYEQAFGLSPEDWDLDRPQRLLAEWAAGRPDVVLVDALPALRKAAAHSPRLYYFPDSHLTAAGHAVLARELAAALTRSQESVTEDQ